MRWILLAVAIALAAQIGYLVTVGALYLLLPEAPVQTPYRHAPPVN